MFYYKNDKGTYAKVWEVDRKEKYTEIRFSTSEKLEDGTYRNSNWGGRLVGHANNGLGKTIEPNQRIIIKSAKITNEPYKTPDGQNRSYLRVVIFDAVNADAPTASEPAKSAPAKEAPAVSEPNDEDLPF